MFCILKCERGWVALNRRNTFKLSLWNFTLFIKCIFKARFCIGPLQGKPQEFRTFSFHKKDKKCLTMPLEFVWRPSVPNNSAQIFCISNEYLRQTALSLLLNHDEFPSNNQIFPQPNAQVLTQNTTVLHAGSRFFL